MKLLMVHNKLYIHFYFLLLVFHFLETPMWSSWGSWQQCSATCGMGHSIRLRTCNNAETYRKCPGKGHQIRPCKNIACPNEKGLMLFLSF